MNNRGRFGYGLALVLAAGGCGDKNNNGDDQQQMDAPRLVDGPAGNLVAGHAHIVVATSAGASFSSLHGGNASIADGRWLLSPDAAKITFTTITLMGEGTNIQAVPLTSCQVTYTLAAATGSQLLDCPFMAPPGTYIGVGITIQRISQILIDDATNGLYTDPGSSTRLSTTQPTGGAAYVEFRPRVRVAPPATSPRAATSRHRSTSGPEPVHRPTCTSRPTCSTPSTQTCPGRARSSTRPSRFRRFSWFRPSVPPVEEFYTSTGTALDVMGGGPTENDIYSVRISYPPTSPQPFGSFSPYAGQAFPSDPATSDVFPDGCKRGGYLGLDASGVVCWAQPANCQYTSYTRLCRLTQQTAIGNTTTLDCQSMSSVPAPTSGATYASGCPAITPDFTKTVTLVAR